MYSYFTHPNELCMSYLEHANISFYYSYKLFLSSIKAFFHSIFPSLYKTSTSDVIYEIGSLLKYNNCN